jgi:hypothetical protein
VISMGDLTPHQEMSAALDEFGAEVSLPAA